VENLVSDNLEQVSLFHGFSKNNTYHQGTKGTKVHEGFLFKNIFKPIGHGLEAVSRYSFLVFEGQNRQIRFGSSHPCAKNAQE